VTNSATYQEIGLLPITPQRAFEAEEIGDRTWQQGCDMPNVRKRVHGDKTVNCMRIECGSQVVSYRVNPVAMDGVRHLYGTDPLI
jgi:hypothetical protein